MMLALLDRRPVLIILAIGGGLLGWGLLMLATAQAAGRAATEQTASLSLSPAAAVVLVSDTLTVDVVVSDVVDLYGAELTLAFDPAIMAVVDANTGAAGVQIAPGGCPEANFVAQNAADNGAGTIQYAVTSLAPAAPCSGAGVVASITFQGLATGTSPISFSNWLLSDSNIQPITTTASTGWLTVEARPGTIEGTVILQGRNLHGGVSVAIWDSAGWPAEALTSTVSGAAGDFVVEAPAGSYTVTVEMAGYLDSLRPAVMVDADGLIELPQLALPCGDPNDDDLVNIQDLTILGSRYGRRCGDPDWDDRADMIDDCTINILDLTCSGVNYGRSSPAAWP